MSPTHRTSADVQARLTALIEQGAQGYGPDDQLPTFAELHKTYGLSVPTVARMIKRMRDAGIIYSVPGKGTFVTARTNPRQGEDED